MRRGLCLFLVLTFVLCSSGIWGQRAQAETVQPVDAVLALLREAGAHVFFVRFEVGGDDGGQQQFPLPCGKPRGLHGRAHEFVLVADADDLGDGVFGGGAEAGRLFVVGGKNKAHAPARKAHLGGRGGLCRGKRRGGVGDVAAMRVAFADRDIHHAFSVCRRKKIIAKPPPKAASRKNFAPHRPLGLDEKRRKGI